MRIEQSKPSITEYGFLRLLVSTLRSSYHEVIIAKHQLEKDLYNFYDSEDFHSLFEDVIKKESIDGNNYVDLNESFQMAYALGLLSMIKDASDDVRSVINLSEEEATDNLKDYDGEQVNKMCQLIAQIKQKDEIFLKKSKGYGVDNGDEYLVKIEIDEEKTIIQRIEKDYVGDDCVQVMFKHTDGMNIIKDRKITFSYLPHDLKNEFGYINDYLHDDRRHLFPYSDTPVHREEVDLYLSYDCVNQLLDYNCMYLILRADKKNNLESEVYCKAIKDGENAIIVQSVNQNSPAFNMNLDELRDIAKSAPQPKIRVKNRDKKL